LGNRPLGPPGNVIQEPVVTAKKNVLRPWNRCGSAESANLILPTLFNSATDQIAEIKHTAVGNPIVSVKALLLPSYLDFVQHSSES
jgi:hypothetical protein